jgi:hypothetical protein
MERTLSGASFTGRGEIGEIGESDEGGESGSEIGEIGKRSESNIDWVSQKWKTRHWKRKHWRSCQMVDRWYLDDTSHKFMPTDLVDGDDDG